MNTDIKPSLHYLAEQIKAEHSAATSAARKTMDHARRAGELLIQAKQQTNMPTYRMFALTSKGAEMAASFGGVTYAN